MCHGATHVVLQNEIKMNVIFTDLKKKSLFSRDQTAFLERMYQTAC